MPTAVGSSLWMPGSGGANHVSVIAIHSPRRLVDSVHDQVKMRRAWFQDQARRLAREKAIKYKGTVSIKIEVLHFPWHDTGEPDERNVERLKKCFRDEGCCRLELQNHIPAVIDQPQLDAALRTSGIPAEQPLEDPRDGYPELKFPPGHRRGGN